MNTDLRWKTLFIPFFNRIEGSILLLLKFIVNISLVINTSLCWRFKKYTLFKQIEMKIKNLKICITKKLVIRHFTLLDFNN